MTIMRKWDFLINFFQRDFKYSIKSKFQKSSVANTTFKKSFPKKSFQINYMKNSVALNCINCLVMLIKCEVMILQMRGFQTHLLEKTHNEHI